MLLDWQLMLLAQQQKIFNGGKKLFDAEGLFLVLGDNAFCPFCVFLLFRWDKDINPINPMNPMNPINPNPSHPCSKLN